MCGTGMVFGGIFIIWFWGAITVLVVWGIKRLTERGPEAGGRKAPLDIVRECYARGEISKQESLMESRKT